MRRAVPGLGVVLGILLGGLPLLADEPQPPPQPPKPGLPGQPQPGAGPDLNQLVEKLVRDLGSPEFAVREQARQALLDIGEPARAALERTMKESDDMEARWRAEQILRRLDRQHAHPMDPEPPGRGQPGPAPVPPAGERPPAPAPREKPLSRAERLFEEFIRRMEEVGVGSPVRGDRVLLEAPGLKLQVSTFSIFPGVQLEVEGHARPYFGRSLDELLMRYPDLAEHPGMPALRTKWKEHLEKRPSPFAIDPSAPFGSGFRSFVRLGPGGQGVDITFDGDEVHVRVTETDEDGKEAVKEYEGRSIPEIIEKNPELKDKLGGLSLEMGPVSPRFFGRPGRQRLPLPLAPRDPQPPVITPGEPMGAVFGVLIEVPEPVLAVHLGIPEGHGALVRQVQPGSQAEAFGLHRYDVILLLDGEEVTDVSAFAARLRQKAETRASLTIMVIRRGERIALSR